mmetsp:Transcript_75955/g.152607  ORF Transcript_75955/g.152607 Transcript_75955/m.152607 type:complete len:212 (-) Transcript_75955:83-718(-)
MKNVILGLFLPSLQFDSDRLVLRADKRSISDYMGGVHAGKYDFDPRLTGVTSFNYDKSVVFEVDANSGKRAILAKIESDDAPFWASRSIDALAVVQGSLNLLTAGSDVAAENLAALKNEEISWEPFYARIEVSGQASPDICVTPMSGILAPRGGAGNACDASSPYSDSCQFAVFFSPLLTTQVEDLPRCHETYLVVRTEMDCWSWQILPCA